MWPFTRNVHRMEQAVCLEGLGPIENDVLVRQLVVDVLERLRQILDLERKISLAAGLFGEVLQDLVAIGIGSG